MKALKCYVLRYIQTSKKNNYVLYSTRRLFSEKNNLHCTRRLLLEKNDYNTFLVWNYCIVEYSDEKLHQTTNICYSSGLIREVGHPRRSRLDDSSQTYFIGYPRWLVHACLLIKALTVLYAMLWISITTTSLWILFTVYIHTRLAYTVFLPPLNNCSNYVKNNPHNAWEMYSSSPNFITQVLYSGAYY